MWSMARAAGRLWAAAGAVPSGAAAHALRAPCGGNGGGNRAYAAVPDSIREALGYCVQQVRQYDYQNYVWVAQMPKDLRPALFTLRAFNIETAQMAELVRSKEAVVGQIRFQWWRDAVKAAFDGRPPSHPVALALGHVLHSAVPSSSGSSSSSSSGRGSAAGNGGGAAGCDSTGCGSTGPNIPGSPAAVDGPAASSGASTSGRTGSGAASGTGKGAGTPYSRYCFKRIIDTREGDFLDPQPPLDLAALEQYAEGTASQLLYLQLAAAGVKHSDADHAASHLGRAVGITTLLRGTPTHAAARRSYLPVDLCAQHRVSQEDVYGGVVTEGMRDVVHQVASLAKGHLDEARRLRDRLPAAAPQVLLPAVAADRYLAALEAANFDPWAPGLDGRSGGKGGAPLDYVLRIKWHQLRNTF